MIPSTLLRQTLSVEPLTGEGAAGPLFGAAVEYPCRLLPKRSWLNAPDSTEALLADAVAHLRPDVSISAGDRATCEGIAYRVLRVETARLLVQSSHLAVYLGRSAT